ncbi:MAG: hypothetical protein K6G88_11630 [Lachnospiraceae bacterium]|nr:hypothetical protein [Lachnospiraceae bacterium]
MNFYYTNTHGDIEKYGSSEGIKVCPKRNKPYRQYREEQMPGCRDKEEDKCPYCREVVETSMSYDYHNYPLTDEEIEAYYNSKNNK